MSEQIELFGDEVISRLARTGIVKAKGVNKKPSKGTMINPLQSARINPYNRFFHHKNVIEPARRVNYKTLRRVAEKAWLINTIIRHQTNKIRPFMQPSDDDQIRGFKIMLKDAKRKPSSDEKKIMEYLQNWVLNTGEHDSSREDSLTDFVTKVLRDKYTLDQVTTEIQKKVSGKPFAFWAVDPATIYRVTEQGYEGDDSIRFIQEVEMVVSARYTADDLIFDYENPRTDIDHFGYGYSPTEMAIELITSLINTFAYNAGVFSEDRLPRGAILIDGDMDQEDVEMMEDYLIGLMSGSPGSKYRIPIIPSGLGKDKSGGIQWVSFQNSNKEMEFSQWTEFLWTSTAALFDTDLEELGIRTQKSTSMMGENLAPRMEISKSRGLQSNIAFLTSHLNKIINKVDSRFEIVFTGLEKDDIKQKNETRESELRTFKSINQVIKENDGSPVKEDWAELPGFLHQNVYQAWSQAKQAEQMQQQGGMGGGMPGMGGPEGGMEEDDGGEYPEDYRSLMMGSEEADEEEENLEGYPEAVPLGKSIQIII